MARRQARILQAELTHEPTNHFGPITASFAEPVWGETANNSRVYFAQRD